MKHRIRVTGIVRKGNSLVMIEQKNPYNDHRHWTFPGGGVELEDKDIFAAVEREVYEEAGLIVKADNIRFISEYFDPKDEMLMVTFWIDCHLLDTGNNHLSLENNVEGDNINDVCWWNIEAIKSEKTQHISRMIRQDKFWTGLEAKAGLVTYLGKSSKIGA
jgi:8-oxo-dGTP diphosphatase